MTELEKYKIKIEGAGLSIDREVSREIGEQVVVLVLTGTHSAGPATSPLTGAAQTVRKSAPAEQSTLVNPSITNPDTSIREFFDSCDAKRVPDKLTAIGEYLKRHNSQTDFDKTDMIANFENAAEPVPKNISRDIKWTLKAGWIALKSGSKDRYYVTNSGKTAVDQCFSKEVVKKTQGMTQGASKKVQKKTNSGD